MDGESAGQRAVIEKGIHITPLTSEGGQITVASLVRTMDSVDAAMVPVALSQGRGGPRPLRSIAAVSYYGYETSGVYRLAPELNQPPVGNLILLGSPFTSPIPRGGQPTAMEDGQISWGSLRQALLAYEGELGASTPVCVWEHPPHGLPHVPDGAFYSIANGYNPETGFYSDAERKSELLLIDPA